MSVLNTHDFVVLLIALDLLSKHTDDELSKARQQGNNAKQMAMLTMRQQIVKVRSKMQAMQVQS